MNKILAFTVLVLAGFVCSQPTTPQEVPLKPKIIGGENAQKYELPYQVQLKFDKGHYCGGSIINENYILTAADCVEGTRKSRFTVIAGEHDISSQTNDGTEQSRSVAEILIHENFKRNEFGQENDIALLKLSSPLEINDAVKPIALPKQGHSATGMALVSGWGKTTRSNSTLPDPTILQKLFVPITTKEVCKTNYGKYVTEDNICAGPPEGGKGFCKGDAGGPLVASDNGTYLAGVVSWGTDVCGGSKRPGVYADVSHFLPWINQKMGAGQVAFGDFVRVKQVSASLVV